MSSRDDDTEVHERVGDYPAGALAYMLLDTSPAMFRHTVHGGRTVELSQTSWEGHILEHEEMRDKLAYIEWCLTRPDLINTDAMHPYRECYYVAYTSPRGRRMWIKTVVQFDESVRDIRGVDGVVVTAHLCSRIKRKEARLWP